MNIEKFKNKGLSGLSNLGNTCYINSCIQIISHTYELNFFLEKETYKQKLKNIYDSALILEWDNLRKLMWTNNSLISPGKFIKTVQKVSYLKDVEIFSGNSQNDIAEFFLFLINCFHNSISREIKMTITGTPENETDQTAIKCFEMIQSMYSKDYSEIWNLFYGVSVSEIINLENGEKVKIIPEPYLSINLHIPKNKNSLSLIECFNYYVDGEILEGENGWYDESTNNKINIKKIIKFWSFPSILEIDFKRFDDIYKKNQILITFPLDDLDLSNYVIGYKKEIYKYELYGVCNHSGGIMGGHYTSYVKNANGKWYHFNDNIVSEVSVNDNIVSPKAYVLFYRKKTN